MKNISLTKNELSIIKQILKNYPETIIFGSRAKETSKKFSDLDICIKENLKDYEYELLKEKFENSDLPFKVDIVEFNKISESFKKIVLQEGIKLSQINN